MSQTEQNKTLITDLYISTFKTSNIHNVTIESLNCCLLYHAIVLRKAKVLSPYLSFKITADISMCWQLPVRFFIQTLPCHQVKLSDACGILLFLYLILIWICFSFLPFCEDTNW